MHRNILFLGVAITILLAVPGAKAGTQPPREDIEWIDIWMPHTNEHALPRVLLIGDSITRNYNPFVEKALQGKAYVCRLTTSHFISDPLLLGQITLLLGQMKFDVIHFNNGMHGFQHTEEEYRAAFPAYLAAIRDHAAGAKLFWASTTPVRQSHHIEQLDPRTERVKVRNAIASEFVSKEGIPVDDLYALVLPHPEYNDAAGVHFTVPGEQAQAAQVAAEIEKVLPPAK